MREVLHKPGLLLSALVVITALLWAFVPTLFTSYDPINGVPREKMRPPDGAHLFGTDEIGRDLFARVVHASALSLRATLLAMLIALVAGSVLGLLAGFVGGLVDDGIMRFVDVLLAIPSLLLAMALVTALGTGTTNVAIAVGIGSAAAFARLMRAEVLRVRTAVYVEAAYSCGVRWYGVLGRHVLPHAIGPVLVLATLTFGTAVLEVSALSFLGFGATPPTPEWGSLVSGGRSYLGSAWWLTTFPGLTIAAVVLATNRISRALDGNR